MNQKNLLPLTLLVSLCALLGACAGSAASSGSGDEHAKEKRGPKPRKTTITGVHERNRPAIRNCFEQASQTGPDDSALDPSQPNPSQPNEPHAVEVELQLPRSGKPSSIRLLDAEEVPEEMRDCLEQALADLEYGEAVSGGTYYQWLTYDAKEETLEFSEPQDAYHRWGLTGDEINAVVADNEAQIDRCYEQGADAKQGADAAKGRVLLTLAIDSEGTVARAGIKKSSLARPLVEDCLVQTVLEMQFPKPRGGGVVVFDLPFRFRPAAGWVVEQM